MVSQPDEIRQRDDPLRLPVLGQGAHQRPALVPVGVDERLDRGGGKRREAVEALVDAALGETAEELDQGVHVRLAWRTQPQRAAAAENDVTDLGGRGGHPAQCRL